MQATERATGFQGQLTIDIFLNSPHQYTHYHEPELFWLEWIDYGGSVSCGAYRKVIALSFGLGAATADILSTLGIRLLPDLLFPVTPQI